MRYFLFILLILQTFLAVSGQNKPTIYKVRGINYYNDRNYKKALYSFEKAIRIFEKKKLYDSSTVFYAGIAALKDSNFNKAIIYLDKCLKTKYKTKDCILYISDAYRGENDLADAERILKEGEKNLPEQSNDLILRLTNIYLAKEQFDKALKYLKIAIKNDSTSAILYFSIGTIYGGLDSNDLTVQSYKKALKVDPAYYDANYNLAAFYYNHAAELHDEQQKIPLSEEKKYEDMKPEINALFLKSLPYLENCYRIRQNDAVVISSLKVVYERLHFKDKGIALYEGNLLELLGRDIVSPE
jgi:tetratricopeptide (TPR) repeat protein